MNPGPISATRAVAIRALSADRLATELVHLFDDAAIPVVLLKGTPLARWLYPKGWVRPVSDIDLLVPPDAVGRAGDLLRRAGWTHRVNPFVTHATTWVKRGVAFPVDLHTSFHFVTIPDECFWDVVAADAGSAEMGDTMVRVPSLRCSLTMLGLHAAAGDGRAVEEFAMAVEASSRRRVLEAVELARQLGAEHAFAVSLRRSPLGVALAEERSLAVSMPPEMALSFEEQPRTAKGFVRLDAATTGADLVWLLGRELIPSPRHLRRCYPRLARSGPLGLALAYVWRPFAVVLHAPAGWRRWLALHRRLDVTRDRTGALERVVVAGEIAWAYVGCRVALRRRGVTGALVWARRPAADADPTDRIMQGPSADIAAGRRLASITAHALRRVPTDSRCLIRSLVLIRLLANRGVRGEVAFAVRRHDPAAHAWVEVAAEAVSPPAPEDFVRVSTR